MSNTPYQSPNPYAGHVPELPRDNSQLVRHIRLGFFAYCGFMACLYSAIALCCIVAMFVADFGSMNTEDRIGTVIGCIVMGCISFPLALLFGSGPFLPRKNWAWIYGIVLIAIGLTSPCCMPVSIPLLIFWIKPELRAFYSS